MIDAAEALERLREGNERFVAGRSHLAEIDVESRRRELRESQQPFAVILGCSDSRVPAELVFDQGLGDLFVIRVAGNVVAPSLIGSVEYAADRLGTRLVVVLGHTGCGAVEATLDELEKPTANRSPYLGDIVRRIGPAVRRLQTAAAPEADPPVRDAFLRRVVRENVRASVDQLRHGPAVLERLIAEKGLVILGAEYELASGRVEFFDRD